MKSWRWGLVCLVGLGACGEEAPSSATGADAGDLGADGGGTGDSGLGDDSGEDADPGEVGPDADDAATGQDAAPDLPTEPPAEVGGERPAPVFVPDDWNTRTDWPLIVLLHGFGVSASIQDFYFQLSERVSGSGFVLITPDGTMNATGQRFWNGSDYCCDLYDEGIDDVAYISGLIEEAVAGLRVDPQRVYLLGHSNGGFMSYRMACERADLITGIASLAGAMLSEPDECEPSRPVSVLQIHGTADGTIFYDGSDVGAGHPSAEESVDWWRQANGCDAQETPEADADYDTSVDGDETDRLSWLGCEGGVRVDLWKMEGSGHAPIVNRSFRDDLVDHILSLPPQSP